MKTILKKLALAFVLGFTGLCGVWAGLETGTYISDLNASNPAAGDAKSQGDDHLRLIKSTIKATFPNVSGAMTLTHTQLNLLDSKSLATSGYQKMPSGLVFNWGSATTNVSGVATVTYASAFGTAALQTWCTQSTGGYVVAQGAPSTTSESVTVYVASTGAAAGAGIAVNCLTIGY